MHNLRRYGKGPYSVVVVHGGPGAAGEMAAVARELSKQWGVLEPLQTANSLEGQVEELKSILTESADVPVALIGFSWGAWLSLIVAAHYPSLVTKLILIGAGPFEEKYAAQIETTRLSRLSEEGRPEYRTIIEKLSDGRETAELLKQLGEIASKADTYDALDDETEEIDFRLEIFQGVWPEAAKLRRSGELLKLAKKIKCPVIAIHGDYDPHPAEGVREPLSRVLKNFEFHLLSRCGHKLWIERYARQQLYRILKEKSV